MLRTLALVLGALLTGGLIAFFLLWWYFARGIRF